MATFNLNGICNRDIKTLDLPALWRYVKYKRIDILFLIDHRARKDTLEYIINDGIIPSEAVQIAAVRSDGFVMKAITKIGIKPSDAVKQAFKDWENNIPRLI